jgi:hypothetical protein
MSTTSAGPQYEADQDTSSSIPIPLRERRRDWFFVVIFAIFASTSSLFDTANMLGRLSPHSRNPLARFIYDFAAGIDPVLIANPRFVQLTVGFVSALLYGIFYLVLIYAFVLGREWIRLPAIFYAGMIVMTGGLYLGVEALGDYKSLCMPTSIAVNGPYSLVALLLVARMWRPHPFTRRAR